MSNNKDLREGLGQIAVRVKDDPVMLRCCRMIDEALAATHAGAAAEPVAVVGSDFTIFWAGAGPIAPLIERHGVKVGSKLYAAPPLALTSAPAEPDAYNRRLRAQLEQEWADLQRLKNAYTPTGTPPAAAGITAREQSLIDGIKRECDHAGVNDMRLPPSFGQREGPIAVREEAVLAAIEGWQRLHGLLGAPAAPDMLREALGYAEHWAAFEEKRGNTLDASRVRKVVAHLRAPAETPPAAGAIDAREQEAALRAKFERLNRDTHGFRRSRRGTYTNASIARDWKWFQLGASFTARDEPTAVECTNCKGRGTEGDHNGERYVEVACDHCNGTGYAALASPQEAPAAAGAAQAVEKWIFDPHDIEQGLMLNPAWLALHGLTPAQAIAAEVAAKPPQMPAPRFKPTKGLLAGTELFTIKEMYGAYDLGRASLKAALPIEREDWK